MTSFLYLVGVVMAYMADAATFFEVGVLLGFYFLIDIASDIRTHLKAAGG